MTVSGTTYDLSSAAIRKYISSDARTRPKPRLRNVSCIREYSPLSSIIAPLIGLRWAEASAGS